MLELTSSSKFGSVLGQDSVINPAVRVVWRPTGLVMTMVPLAEADTPDTVAVTVQG
jgi:hypothetical protein